MKLFKVTGETKLGARFEQYFTTKQGAQSKLTFLEENNWINLTLETVDKDSFEELGDDALERLKDAYSSLNSVVDIADDDKVLSVMYAKKNTFH